MKLYMDCSKMTTNKIIIYLVLFWYLLILHLLIPFTTQPNYKRIGNETIEVRNLPITVWIPFDEHTYFVVSYKRIFLFHFLQIWFFLAGLLLLRFQRIHCSLFCILYRSSYVSIGDVSRRAIKNPPPYFEKFR